MARPQKISDEEILAAARAYFVDQGTHASTDVLADQLGVSSAALFKRFGTKHRLLIAALTPRVPAWVSTLADGPAPSRPVRDQLGEIALNIFRFLREALPCMIALRGEVERAELPQVDGVPGPVLVQQGLKSFITQAQAAGDLGPGDPLAMAQALVGGVQARVMLEHLVGEMPGDDVERVGALVDVLFAGFAPRASADNRPAARGPTSDLAGLPASHSYDADAGRTPSPNRGDEEPT